MRLYVNKVNYLATTLDLAIDLGPLPSLEDVTQHLAIVNDFWLYAAELVVQEYERGTDSLDDLHSNLGHLVDDDSRSDALRVQRMQLQSPWEALLTVAAEKSAPVLYAGAALVAMERLLRMVMDWQRHRLDLEERRAQLLLGPSGDAETILTQYERELPLSSLVQSAREATAASDSEEELSTELVTMIPEAIVDGSESPRSRAARGIDQLAESPILRVELRSNRPVRW